MKINVLLADKHTMFRQGLVKQFNDYSDITIIGETDNGYECLNLISKYNPDLIIMDFDLLNLNAIEILQIMIKKKLNNKVIILSDNDSIDLIISALDNSCQGYVLKSSDFKVLLEAIFTLQKGYIYRRKR